LHERTEGRATGLRLAALGLAGHPDPEVLAARFSAPSGRGRVASQRVVVGIAMGQLRPRPDGHQGRRPGHVLFRGHAVLEIPPTPTWAMITVIVGWSAIGGWPPATPDNPLAKIATCSTIAA
jgi:hypothetical protein